MLTLLSKKFSMLTILVSVWHVQFTVYKIQFANCSGVYVLCIQVAELVKEMEQRLFKFNIQKPRYRQDHRNMGRLTPEERLVLKVGH